MNESRVEFQGYSVSSLEMEKVLDNKKKKESSFEIKSNFFQNVSDKLSYKLVMNLVVISEKHKINMTLEGFFKFNSRLDDEMIEQFFNVNARMILYPYCRTIISSITSLDSPNSVLLPIINFQE